MYDMFYFIFYSKIMEEHVTGAFIDVIKSGNVKLVKEYLQHPSIDPTEEDFLAIKVAALHGYSEIVQILLQCHKLSFANASIILRTTISLGYIDLLEIILLDECVQNIINENSYHISHHIKKQNCVQIAEMMLTSKQYDANSLLIWSIQEKHYYIFGLIMDHPRFNREKITNALLTTLFESDWWLELIECLQTRYPTLTGKISLDSHADMEKFKYIAKHPNLSIDFNLVCAQRSYTDIKYIAEIFQPEITPHTLYGLYMRLKVFNTELLCDMCQTRKQLCCECRRIAYLPLIIPEDFIELFILLCQYAKFTPCRELAKQVQNYILIKTLYFHKLITNEGIIWTFFDYLTIGNISTMLEILNEFDDELNIISMLKISEIKHIIEHNGDDALDLIVKINQRRRMVGSDIYHLVIIKKYIKLFTYFHSKYRYTDEPTIKFSQLAMSVDSLPIVTLLFKDKKNTIDMKYFEFLDWEYSREVAYLLLDQHLSRLSSEVISMLKIYGLKHNNIHIIDKLLLEKQLTVDFDTIKMAVENNSVDVTRYLLRVWSGVKFSFMDYIMNKQSINYQSLYKLAPSQSIYAILCTSKTTNPYYMQCLTFRKNTYLCPDITNIIVQYLIKF